MSNLEKAVDLILPYTGDCDECERIGGACLDCVREAKEAAQDLANDGLLASDLLEPAYFESGEVEWDTLDGYVNINDGLITVSYSETNEHDDAPTVERLTPEPGQLKFLDPAAAKDIGTLLTAAAHHAERNRK